MPLPPLSDIFPGTHPGVGPGGPPSSCWCFRLSKTLRCWTASVSCTVWNAAVPVAARGGGDMGGCQERPWWGPCGGLASWQPPPSSLSGGGGTGGIDDDDMCPVVQRRRMRGVGWAGTALCVFKVGECLPLESLKHEYLAAPPPARSVCVAGIWRGGQRTTI